MTQGPTYDAGGAKLDGESVADTFVESLIPVAGQKMQAPCAKVDGSACTMMVLLQVEDGRKVDRKVRSCGRRRGTGRCD